VIVVCRVGRFTPRSRVGIRHQTWPKAERIGVISLAQSAICRTRGVILGGRREPPADCTPDCIWRCRKDPGNQRFCRCTRCRSIAVARSALKCSFRHVCEASAITLENPEQLCKALESVRSRDFAGAGSASSNPARWAGYVGSRPS
jgi:hypothetical protein